MFQTVSNSSLYILDFCTVWIFTSPESTFPLLWAGSISSVIWQLLDYANWLSSWMDLTVYKVKSGGKHVDLLSADRLISKAIWASFLEFFPSPSKAQNVISTHLNSQHKQWWLQADEDWDGFYTSICHLWFLDNYFHRAVLIRRQDGGEGLVLLVFKSSVSGSGLAQSRYSINVTQKISVFNNNCYFKNIYFIKNHHTLKLTFWCADLWIFTHV